MVTREWEVIRIRDNLQACKVRKRKQHLSYVSHFSFIISVSTFSWWISDEHWLLIFILWGVEKGISEEVFLPDILRKSVRQFAESATATTSAHKYTCLIRVLLQRAHLKCKKKKTLAFATVNKVVYSSIRFQRNYFCHSFLWKKLRIFSESSLKVSHFGYGDTYGFLSLSVDSSQYLHKLCKKYFNKYHEML